jgi:predicted aminopeptidase
MVLVYTFGTVRKSLRLAQSVCLAALAFSLCGCYLLKQGGYIIRYNREAVGIDEVLKQRSLSSDERDFLLLVKEIKQYAVDEIGLKQDDNYTRFVAMPKDYLADVVSACRPDSFEIYRWKYPVFGYFPYKGFFEREDAIAEARRLKKQGYDVLVRKVDAFSSLGFFNDPVFSFMTNYSIFEIASLIIHEQTHATMYLKDQIQFNEEMATFVGNEGALQFIREKYGERSEEYDETITTLEDIDTFKEVIREIHDELKEIYQSDRSREEKLRIKEEVFAEAQRRFKESYEERFNTDNFLPFGELKLNNAYIMLYVLYTQNLQIFYDLFEQNGKDLRSTVAALKSLAETARRDDTRDAREYIREALLQ